jgi:hypothetical protein
VRTSEVDRQELISRLANGFGYNEPIFTTEIQGSWREYSRPRIFQLLADFEREGVIARSGAGVYYLPTQTLLGASVLGNRKIIDKKYIRSGDSVYGYYTGLKLLNELRLTQQMPARLEVVTSKASAQVRSVKIGESIVTVRKSRVPVDKNNVAALILLEAFNEVGRSLTPNEARGIREFVEERALKTRDVFRFADNFPAKAIRNLIGTGVENVFAQG